MDNFGWKMEFYEANSDNQNRRTWAGSPADEQQPKNGSQSIVRPE